MCTYIHERANRPKKMCGWHKPYTVFFKICDESEIIVYVMPGDKNKIRISKDLSAAQKIYI